MNNNNKNDYTEADVPDQTGKTFFITGANTGIGYDTARVLASRNARVLLGCRSEEKANRAMSAIKTIKVNADVAWIPLDLTSLKAIENAALMVREEEHLDAIINNAGVMVTPKTVTEDGFELQFGVNHLGHFALTGHLIEKLLTNPTSRIVNVSSLAHRRGKIDYQDIHASQSYNRMRRYQMSKFANILFTLELDRKLRHLDSNVLAVACHPGVSVTELFRHSAFNKLFSVFSPMMNSSAEGALPTLMAATDPSVKGGDYYGPKKMGEMRHSSKKVAIVNSARDEEDALRLWELSEKLTGVHYELK